jgi:predicted nucleotide-binding protein (sugar kinase/HSP70/actin superfamily)
MSVSDISSGYAALQKVRVVTDTNQARSPSRPPPQLPPRMPEGPPGHYRTYQPRPFTREERDRVTVLFGGLHWRAERLIQGAMENLGYRVRVLPVASRADLLTGREVADIGQCCPTSFTTGNLANFLRDEAKRVGAQRVADEYIYITAGACGACRFGQYHQSYELALRNVGLESFRMFLLSQTGLDQGPAHGGGLDLNPSFTMGAVWGVLVADVVQDLEYQIRPYEKNPGETDRVTREAVEYLYDEFRKLPQRRGLVGTMAWHLATGYFVRALREVRRRYDAIEVDRLRVKPMVKITGEFYLQTVEGDPNYNIHRWLEAEGAEVYPAAVTIWLDYLMRHGLQAIEERFGIERSARFKYAGLRAGQGLLRWTYNRMRRALAGMPREMPDQFELRALAAPYFHARLSGGEGDMLIGKALWSHLRKKAHMTCELSPYACMPNTMSIGAMAAVLGKHPDLLYAPIEIKGDAEVHALSRCQMVLTEAKKRAVREFESVLERIGMTESELAAAVAERPELSRATYRIPHYGVAGTAANLALHVAAGRR